jgi:hypothetical protein
MKSGHAAESHLLRSQPTSLILGRYRGFNSLKERAMTAAALAATVVAIVALYAVMCVALYRWIHYAPILPSDGGALPAIKETLHWLQKAG